jgi:division protein CdvB (Snf7/Vps24/ESCRT-III family)
MDTRARRKKTIKSLTNSNPPPIREIATKSIYTLKIQQNKLEQASFRLRERDRILFETCMSALKKNNKDKASMCANEIAEVRKLIQFLGNVQLAIERVILRLDTIKELSDIVVDLKPALKLLSNVSSELFQVLPDVSSELDTVNSTIQDTLHATKIQQDAETLVPVGRKTESGDEILREVSGFIEQKLAETLPEPPVISSKMPVKQKMPVKELVALSATSSQISGHKVTEESGFDVSKTMFTYKKSEVKEITMMKVKQPTLEDVLMEYVRKTNGEIDLGRCSTELKASNEDIEHALENLGSQGKIKIEVKSP